MAVVEFVRRIRGIQFTGSNGAEIVTALGYYDDTDGQKFPTVVSQTSQQLTLSLITTTDHWERTFANGDWILIPEIQGQMYDFGVLGSNATVTTQYIPVNTLVNP